MDGICDSMVYWVVVIQTVIMRCFRLSMLFRPSVASASARTYYRAPSRRQQIAHNPRESARGAAGSGYSALSPQMEHLFAVLLFLLTVGVIVGFGPSALTP